MKARAIAVATTLVFIYIAGGWNQSKGADSIIEQEMVPRDQHLTDLNSEIRPEEYKIEEQEKSREEPPGTIRPEPETEENDSLEYLGCWCITAYCPCEKCCGVRTGITASEKPAVSGHTVACNILPFGTDIIIDGITYTVEDTGYTEFGDQWVDIFFDTHEEALNYGVQWHDVYVVR